MIYKHNIKDQLSQFHDAYSILCTLMANSLEQKNIGTNEINPNERFGIDVLQHLLDELYSDIVASIDKLAK